MLCSIMLNILGEADGDEGLQRAHEVMARAYAVRHARGFLHRRCFTGPALRLHVARWNRTLKE